MSYKVVKIQNNLPRRLTWGDKPLIEFREISPEKMDCSRDGGTIYGGFRKDDFRSVYLGQEWVDNFWGANGYDFDTPIPAPCYFFRNRVVIREFANKMLKTVLNSTLDDIRVLAEGFQELVELAFSCYADTRWNHGYASRGETARERLQLLRQKAEQVRMAHYDVTVKVLQEDMDKYYLLRNAGQYLGELGRLVSVWHALLFSEGGDTKGVLNGSLLVVHFTERGMKLYEEIKNAIKGSSRDFESHDNALIDEWGRNIGWKHDRDFLALQRLKPTADEYGVDIVAFILCTLGWEWKGMSPRRLADALAQNL